VADAAPPGGPGGLGATGVVAIGRNEGDRLVRCLDSLPRGVRGVVYVDSASTDGSVAEARARGHEVVELDLSVPFTAARARNAGLRRLREAWPGVRWVQFLDGDCALAPGWLEAAVREIEGAPDLAVVCGRRREVHPEASPYNRLCDMEWDTPVGDAEACGGDALARVEALEQVGGFDGALIAGEEPDLCARLRARRWRIRRVDREMTLHDAAMTRFGQWWRRSVRAGHAYAEVGARHPAMWGRDARSIAAWGIALPAAAVLGAVPTGGWSLALLLAYPALWLRVRAGRRAGGAPARDAALYATSCVAGKLPMAAGAARFWWNRLRGRRGGLIEYK
jgi:glycosyltransferase involved in cell wall biosynthesis